MYNETIKQLRDLAQQNNIDIKEIVVSPILYEKLFLGGVLTTIRLPGKEPYTLNYDGITVTKRECKACCLHVL